MHHELRRDLDCLRVAAGFLGHLVHLFHECAEAIDLHAGRQPTIAPGDRAPDVVGVIAADVDRDTFLIGLRIKLDILEAVVLALERRDAVGKQKPQGLQALVDDIAALELAVRLQRLEFLTIGADADADLEPSLAEMVERRDLLCRHNNIAAHRQDQHAGADLQGRGVGEHERVDHQRLPEPRRHRKLGAHIVLCGHVVVAPHRVVTEFFRGLRDADDGFRLGERNRIGEALHSGRQSGADT